MGIYDLIENKHKAEIHVGGETNIKDYDETIPDLQNRLQNRMGLYPKGGYYKYFHPITNDVMSPLPQAVFPFPSITLYPVKQCITCNSSLRKPIPPLHFWRLYWNKPYCLQIFCEYKRTSACPCVFEREPSFNIRGLCRDAVMDTNYKLADHQPSFGGLTKKVNEK